MKRNVLIPPEIKLLRLLRLFLQCLHRTSSLVYYVGTKRIGLLRMRFHIGRHFDVTSLNKIEARSEYVETELVVPYLQLCNNVISVDIVVDAVGSLEAQRVKHIIGFQHGHLIGT